MYDVYLYIYDLSMGIAKSLAARLLGTHIEGIWHTGVVVHGKEIFYGSQGISECHPCGTVLKEPLQKLLIGQTSVTNDQLTEYLRKLSRTSFKGGHYRLFDHNCNTFSEHLVFHLTNQHIPDYILSLPHEVAATPLGALLKPALNAFSAGMDSEPMFDRSEYGVSMRNHSFEEIKKSFKPILFDEPLSADLTSSKVALLWSSGSGSEHMATMAKRLAQSVETATGDLTCDLDQFGLLAVDRLQTADQCFAVLELFRLAIWRDPSLLTAMLTEPQKHLQRLSLSRLPDACAGSSVSALDLETSRAKLLCNYVGLSVDWDLDGNCTSGEHPNGGNSELQLDADPLLHIALMLLGHSDHLRHPGHRSSDDRAISADQLMSEHREVGLALAHNLSLHWQLQDSAALEMGIYLIHLAVNQGKSYKQPSQAINLLRTIYYLVVRFPTLAEYAKVCDLQACLTIVLEEATSPDDQTDRAGVSSGKQSSNGGPVPVGQPSSCSLDYACVSYLIDFLGSA